MRSGTVEPQFRARERPSKLDPFAEKLSDWLRIDAGKSRKQKRTAKQMHADLVVLGYDGSYGRVAAFVRAWKADRQREQQTSGRGTFVPLVFAPGEAFQFDWSEDWAILGGKQVKLQAAHTKLSHSKAFIVRAYPLQTHEMLFDALTQAFRVLGGVPQRGIFDNMKTAVDRIGTGKARQVRQRDGRKGRSRRMSRMHGADYGSDCRASRISMHSTFGSRSSASHNGLRSSMAVCPAPSLKCTPKR